MKGERGMGKRPFKRGGGDKENRYNEREEERNAGMEVGKEGLRKKEGNERERARLGRREGGKGGREGGREEGRKNIALLTRICNAFVGSPISCSNNR